ncbi:Uncharacterised protein [Mycobacteroides abscessus subsp. massiliense]|nr:Uncharacterised protein [Mycobacteroides abscessus subsp. massiliense]
MIGYQHRVVAGQQQRCQRRHVDIHAPLYPVGRCRLQSQRVDRLIAHYHRPGARAAPWALGLDQRGRHGYRITGGVGGTHHESLDGGTWHRQTRPHTLLADDFSVGTAGEVAGVRVEAGSRDRGRQNGGMPVRPLLIGQPVCGPLVQAP